MKLSETIKLYPTAFQSELIQAAMAEYISVVNSLVSDAVNGTSIKKLTTAGVSANLPAAIVNQCIRDANSIVRKHYKNCRHAILKNRKLADHPERKVTAPRLPLLKNSVVMSTTRTLKSMKTALNFRSW